MKVFTSQRLTEFGKFRKNLGCNLRAFYCFQSIRQFTRVLQPLAEDFSPISQEQLTAYKNILNRYDQLSKQSVEGGGPRGIERHVVKNKKVLVRDRIKLLIDPGTYFFEIGQLAGFEMEYGDVPAGGVVNGIGRVAGIYCLIGGNDATVKGGTYFPITVKKSERTQTISQQNRLPSIYMPDSGGAYLPLQSEIFIPGGKSFFNQATMSSKGIPQIAIVCGSCTAGGAYNPTMSDEAIIIDQIGKIFLGGPPLVKAATGEIVTEEDLGGAFMHSTVSGYTDYFAQDEKSAFEMCRDVVEGLNLKSVEVLQNFESPVHLLDSWDDFGSREHLSKCDMYAVLSTILDGSQLKEFKAFYGPGLISGIGRIEGMLVGVVANIDDIASSEAVKACHFLDMCNRRDIPILFLQNSLPPSLQDAGHFNEPYVLRDRAKLSRMVSTLEVPKISLTTTACYGDDHLLMCGTSFKPNFHFMWPSARLSTFEMTYVEGDFSDSTFDAFTAAFNVLTDGVILPQNTRQVLAESLRILWQQKLNPERKVQNPVFRM